MDKFYASASLVPNPEAGNLPLGWVADTYGRKVVLSLHKINMIFSGALFILFCNSIPILSPWPRLVLITL